MTATAANKILSRQEGIRRRIEGAARSRIASGSSTEGKGELQARLAGLEAEWAKFDANNGILFEANLDGKLDELPYFRDDVFGTTRDNYYSYKGILIDPLGLRSVLTESTVRSKSRDPPLTIKWLVALKHYLLQ